MLWFITCYPIVNIKTIKGHLSLSIQFGGLVPGRNLVLVFWEQETVSHRMDNQLVAIWAHSLGSLVTASVAPAATAATAAAAATAATNTTAISFGHRATRTVEFCFMMRSNCLRWVSSSVRSRLWVWFVWGRGEFLCNILPSCSK
jgi:hypothetical protein